MSAWMQTLTGRALVINEPVVQTAHLFTEIAPALARTPRFGGHTNETYSVAEHSLLCAVNALQATGDRELAAMCLLHDAHEAYTGDLTRPMQEAIEDELAAGLDPTTAQLVAEHRARAFRDALHRIQSRLDVAIAYAAGFDEQTIIRHRAAVKRFDVRALRTERDGLMLPPPMPWHESVEAADPLLLAGWKNGPMPEHMAHELFVAALQDLCPHVSFTHPHALATA